jgi:AcrR family transcriptional regulator
MAVATEPNLRELKRRAVRGHLSEVALELLADRDFESVTVEEIAAAAGVGRRTFFRYFASKEDVVLEFLDRMGERLRESIVARPLGEPPLVAVHNALRPQMAAYAAAADRTLALVRLLQRSPALRARELESRQALREKVAEAISQRLGLAGPVGMRSRLLAGVALVPLDVSITTWLEAETAQDVHAILDHAIASLAQELSELG